MRVVVARDGRSVPVNVAPGLDSVEVDGHAYPVTVVRVGPLSVELEIAGEKVVVDQWPDHFADPPGPVDVNGERWSVRVERGSALGPPAAGPKPAPSGPGPVPAPGGAAPVGGMPVSPPMPGKVIEVRVSEGDRVHRGDVLLVLEAMKMRNEVASPADGVVRGLRVRAGANARAKEPMLFVAPE
jgi:glutaconyl-CoA/methylmalonyl-CoA decarboxylase subunit gamma